MGGGRTGRVSWRAGILLGLGGILAGCSGAVGGIIGAQLRVSAPTFSPQPGTFQSDQQVALTSTTEDASIFYTTDGRDPVAWGELYGGPIPVEGDGTSLDIRAYAAVDGLQRSQVVRGVFTVTYEALPDVEAEPSAGTASAPIEYGDPVQVSLSIPGHSDAVIHYNVNGGPVTRDDPQYDGPIELTTNGTYVINAFATKDGFADSEPIAFGYTIDLGQTAEPTFRRADGTPITGGTYPFDLEIELTSSTTDADIYFNAVDGADPPPTPIPGDASSTLFQPGSPIPVLGDGTERTIRAIAVSDLRGDSDPATATFIIRYPRLSLQSSGNGSVEIPDPGGTGPVPVVFGDATTIEAIPETGYEFAGWTVVAAGTDTPAEVTIADPAAAQTTVTLGDTDALIQGSFAPRRYDLATHVIGSGTIALTPAGGSYDFGVSVVVQASPSSGWSFAGWSGDLSGTDTTASILMNDDKSVTATFVAPQIAVTPTAPQDLGRITEGETSDPVTYTIENTGSAPLTLQRPTTGGTLFSVSTQWGGDSIDIAPGDSTTFDVTLFGASPGDYNDTITIESNGAANPVVTREVTGSVRQLFAEEHTLPYDTFNVFDVAISDGDTHIATGLSGGWAIWDRDGTTWSVNQAELDPGVISVGAVAFDDSASSNSLLVALGFNTGDLAILQEDQGSWVGFGNITDAHAAPIRSIDFAPANLEIATGGDDNVVRIWEFWEGSWLETELAGHTGSVNGVDWSDDGNLIVSGANDRTIRIWEFDGTDWNNTVIADAHSNWIRDVAFSPDATRIASAGRDSVARVWQWNGTSWELEQTLSTHTATVTSVDFGPDGTQLVTGSDDNTVILWEYNGSDWVDVQTLDEHTNFVTSVDFNSTGSIIVTGGWDDVTRVYE